MESFDLARTLFFGLIALVVPFAGYRVYWTLKTRAPRAFAQLDARGYAVEHFADGDHSVHTRAWGRFAEPTRLYLQLSNRPGLRKWVGVADIEFGDESFDKAFWVRSNDAGLARLVLDGETRRRLLEFEDLEFQTGSPCTLLSADYWPKNKGEQRQRTLWCVRTRGQRDESQIASHLRVARQLVSSIERVAPSTSDREATHTHPLEGA